MSEDRMLMEVETLVSALKATNSQLDKIEILKSMTTPLCKVLLNQMFNPYVTFGIKSSNCIKNKDMIFDAFSMFDDNLDGHVETISDMLLGLADRKFTGHDAIRLVNTFIDTHRDYEQLIYNILDKDLRCGVTATLINKVYPGLIPEFKVALANKYEEKLQKRIDFTKYLISTKLDGVRLLTFISKNSCRFFSRKGKEFFTLNVLKEALLPYFKDMDGEYVLDGEICLMENGKEVFSSVVKQLRKKDHTIKSPMYKVFDFLTKDEFEEKAVSKVLFDRYNDLRKLFEVKSDYLDVLQQTFYTPEIFSWLQEKAKRNCWEGLILRANIPYEGKRSNGMLKFKLWIDDEYIVKGVEVSEKMMLENGIMVNKKCIGSLIIEHKGEKVGVGSGLSDTDRLEWYADSSLIVGKEITVKYFEETVDEDGKLSLRFPTLKFVYENGRDE